MCGPFTNVTSPWDMVQSDISNFSILSRIVYEVLVNVIIVWFIVLFFYLKFSFTESSLGVLETAIAERALAFETATAASEAKIRKLTKQVQKLELANAQ